MQYSVNRMKWRFSGRKALKPQRRQVVLIPRATYRVNPAQFSATLLRSFRQPGPKPIDNAGVAFGSGMSRTTLVAVDKATIREFRGSHRRSRRVRVDIGVALAVAFTNVAVSFVLVRYKARHRQVLGSLTSPLSQSP